LRSTAIIGILKGDDARVEIVASDEISKSILERHSNVLERSSSLHPCSIRFVCASAAEKVDEFDENQLMIGVDFRA